MGKKFESLTVEKLENRLIVSEQLLELYEDSGRTRGKICVSDELLVLHQLALIAPSDLRQNICRIIAQYEHVVAPDSSFYSASPSL